MISFKKGIAGTFISKSLVAGIGLLTVVLISNLLGAEGRGFISLFLTSVAMLQLVCDYGNNSSIINLSYTHSVKNIRGSAIIWTAIVCLLAFPILYLAFNLPYFYLIPIAAFIYTLINLNHLILMGQRQVAFRNISLLVFPACLFLGLFVYSKFRVVNEVDYFYFLFTALVMAFIVSYFLMQKNRLKEQAPFRFEWDVMKNGLWVQTGQGIQLLNYRLNFFLVAFFINEYALGVFNNAVIICEALWILGHSIGQIQHLKIINTEDAIEHIKLTKKLMMYNFIGTLFLMLIVMSIPNFVWIRLFSQDFEAMKTLFVYLAPGVMAFSISNIISHYFHAKNRFKIILYCHLIGLIAGIAASLMLIPSKGLPGASIAWSIGLIFSMFSYLLVFFRNHGINRIKS